MSYLVLTINLLNTSLVPHQLPTEYDDDDQFAVLRYGPGAEPLDGRVYSTFYINARVSDEDIALVRAWMQEQMPPNV
jgi:hypothetical protein